MTTSKICITTSSIVTRILIVKQKTANNIKARNVLPEILLHLL